MRTDAEDEEWPTPGNRGYSFFDPPGPFRPLRRGTLWLLAALVALIIVVAGAGLALEDQGIYGHSILLMLAIPGVTALWLALWAVDTVLAYLKA